MRNITVIFSLLLLFAGCSVEQRMHKNPVLKNRICSACGGRDTILRIEKDSFSVEIRDTLINIHPDTAAQQLYLECDSLGRIYIKDMQTKNGRIVWLNTQLRDNVLVIEAIKLNEKILLEKLRQYEKSGSRNHTKTVTEIKIPTPYLPWWVKWFLYPLSVIGAIATIYSIIRWGIPLIIKAVRKGAIGI